MLWFVFSPGYINKKTNQRIEKELSSEKQSIINQIKNKFGKIESEDSSFSMNGMQYRPEVRGMFNSHLSLSYDSEDSRFRPEPGRLHNRVNRYFSSDIYGKITKFEGYYKYIYEFDSSPLKTLECEFYLPPDIKDSLIITVREVDLFDVGTFEDIDYEPISELLEDKNAAFRSKLMLDINPNCYDSILNISKLKMNLHSLKKVPVLEDRVNSTKFLGGDYSFGNRYVPLDISYLENWNNLIINKDPIKIKKLRESINQEFKNYNLLFLAIVIALNLLLILYYNKSR
jgi:hypothetical protein